MIVSGVSVGDGVRKKSAGTEVLPSRPGVGFGVEFDVGLGVGFGSDEVVISGVDVGSEEKEAGTKVFPFKSGV